MPKVYMHEEPQHRLESFARSRLREIRDEINDLKAEETVWDRVIELNNACTRCGGEGKHLRLISQDEHEMIDPCKKCKGTGKATHEPDR